jgi:caffeoyl-CoA O-methyltransferase
MFNPIPQSITDRMASLEEIDQRDRSDGTPQSRRLRQITREAGRLLALLAASAPAGAWLEVGASAGYSALWLSLACRERHQTLTTFEISPEKASLAIETFEAANVTQYIHLVNVDFRQLLANYHQVAFCFMDAEKNDYQICYDLVLPNLVTGGWFVADNVISHQVNLQPFIDAALSDRRVDAMVVPVGKGLLVCRKAEGLRDQAV